jgi:hypothetical protein
VVWQGSAGDRRPYADQTGFWDITRVKSRLGHLAVSASSGRRARSRSSSASSRVEGARGGGIEEQRAGRVRRAFCAVHAHLATFRRKIQFSGEKIEGEPNSAGCQNEQTRRFATGGVASTMGLHHKPLLHYRGSFAYQRRAIARPMLMRLSAMTPKPTQRLIPSSPL